MSPLPHARRAAMRVSGARDGASIRATRVTPTVPDASAMVAARVASGIGGASRAIGIATATAVAVTGRPQSAAPSALQSARLIAMVPSAKGSNATITATATPPRLLKTQPAK